MAANIPMIAITIISSIRVKPRDTGLFMDIVKVLAELTVIEPFLSFEHRQSTLNLVLDPAVGHTGTRVRPVKVVGISGGDFGS